MTSICEPNWTVTSVSILFVSLLIIEVGLGIIYRKMKKERERRKNNE